MENQRQQKVVIATERLANKKRVKRGSRGDGKGLSGRKAPIWAKR